MVQTIYEIIPKLYMFSMFGTSRQIHLIYQRGKPNGYVKATSSSYRMIRFDVREPIISQSLSQNLSQNFAPSLSHNIPLTDNVIIMYTCVSFI